MGPPKQQSLLGAFASGVGTALSNEATMSLNERIQDQQAQKKIARQREQNKLAGLGIVATLPKNSPLRQLKEEQLENIDPETLLKLNENLQEYSMSNLSAELANDFNPDNFEKHPNLQGALNSSSVGENLGPQALESGQVGQIGQAPQPIEARVPNVLQTAPNLEDNKEPERSPKEIYDRNVALIKKMADAKAKNATTAERKVIFQAKDKAIANEKTKFDVAKEQKKLDTEIESKDLQKRKIEKELQELPKPVLDKMIEDNKREEKAIKNLGALEEMTKLLNSGVQLPAAITSINQLFGKDSTIAKVATAMALDPKSEAFETARLGLLDEMKEIFGQTRVAEFTEFMKKLPDIRDPSIANKLKIAYLTKLAKSAALPGEGLRMATKEDRKAPSDVIFDKARFYTRHMQKALDEFEDAHIDYIMNPKRYEGQYPVRFPDGKLLIVPKVNLQKAKDQQGEVLSWD